MAENENLCFDSKDIDVEKVTELELIFRMIGKKPYYEIKYKKVGENFYHIGYSSYDVETVLMYKEKYFEIVEGKETNADRIRSMTDEELAEILSSYCVDKSLFNKCSLRYILSDENVCKKCYLEWLKSENEVGKDA